jgi:hypothetical protein
MALPPELTLKIYSGNHQATAVPPVPAAEAADDVTSPRGLRVEQVSQIVNKIKQVALNKSSLLLKIIL